MDSPIPVDWAARLRDPTSCVAGLAAIETIEKDGLAGVVDSDRKRLKSERKAWEQKWPIVRMGGLGGMMPIELVSNRETRRSLPARRTNRVSKYAYEHGLITSRRGRYGNVVRIWYRWWLRTSNWRKGLDVLEAGLALVSEQSRLALSHA